MADVVGTALVRVKLITDKLAKDIEKSVKKGMKDAKLDKVAKKEGEDFGEEFGDSLADSTEKTLKKRSKDMVPGDEINDEFGKIIKRTNKQFGQLSFDDALRGVRENFHQLELDFPEFDDIDIDVDVDTDGANDAFRVLQNNFDHLNFDLPEFDDIDIDVDVDSAAAQAKLAQIQLESSVTAKDIHINVDTDSLDAQAKLAQIQLESAVTGKDIDIDVDVDSAGAEASLARVIAESAIATKDIDINVDVDSARAEAALARLRLLSNFDNVFKNFGGGGGGGGGLPHLGHFSRTILGIGGAITATLPYIQATGSAILAYVNGLVAQIGFLSAAVGGVSVAAAGALGGIATSILPIILAFTAETEALVEFKDSIGATAEEFQKIGIATQQTLLPALDEAFFILGDLIPMFSEFGFFVGRSVGDFAKLAANVLVGGEAQGRFQAILQSSLRILDIFLPTLIDVGDIISGIWVAAIPVAERFAAAVADVTDRWAEMVGEGLRTGELAATFDLWYDRASLVGGALKDLTGALIDIFGAGASAANDTFERFADWAAEYRAFTESEAGQNRLALIFENSLAVMREVNAVIADIFDGIFGRLGEVGGVDSMVAALQRFRDVIPEIQEFWANALVVIDRVVHLFASTIWEKITQAWEQMAEPLGRLAEQFFDLLQVMNDSGAFSVFLDLMEVLTNVLSTLLAIPGFGTFIAYFLAFGGALKVATFVLGPFLKLFAGFGGLIITLIKVNAGAQLVGVAGGLSKLVAAMRAAIAVQAASNLMSAFGGGAAAAGGFTTALKAAATVLLPSAPLMVGLGVLGAGLVVAGGAFFAHQQRAQKWRQEIRQATEALGLLNDGLNVTAEGVTKYIDEFSRFESRDQIDDLMRLGFTTEELGEQVSTGALSYVEFAEAALKADEVFVTVNDRTKDTTSSLASLASQYGLTNDEIIRLAKGEEVYADGTKLVIEGNTSILDSFVELNKVLGAAAKESIDGFISNAQNLRLLGPSFLNQLKKDIDDARDEDADQIMDAAQGRLAAAAIKSSAAIRGLSDATRDQIREQVTLADGTVDVVRENQLLTDALAKQSAQIREDLDLFASIEFDNQFLDAKLAALDFVDVIANIDFSTFAELDLDDLVEKFPEAMDATHNLFRALEGMPEDAFRATATAIGADADKLKAAMEGSRQAIIDLQNTAIETLPSIGELLDDATSTKEDGSQGFDTEGFQKATQERIQETINFGHHIEDIRKRFGPQAAIQAAQEGPKAAANLSKIVGADADALKITLNNMESAERFLKEQIAEHLGPAIELQYVQTGKVFGTGTGMGIAGGLNSPEVTEALKDSSLDTLNYLAQGFRGRFDINHATGELTFTHTGTFERTRRSLTPGQKRMLTMAHGGYVEKYGIAGTFNKSFGTDTVPAMLTPGEFVNTAATVDRLGVDFFDALNRGKTPVAPVPVGGGGINANGWTFIVPDAEEAGRQTISRLRTASFLLGGG